MKRDAQKVSIEAKAKRDGVINPQNYIFNQCSYSTQFYIFTSVDPYDDVMSEHTFMSLQLIQKRREAIEKVKRYLAETIADHERSFEENNIRDFIDLYIKATKDETEPEIFTGKKVIKRIISIMTYSKEY